MGKAMQSIVRLRTGKMISAYSKTFKALGTQITLKCFGNIPHKIFDLSQKLIEYYEKIFSFYLSSSQVNKINKAAGKNAVNVNPSVFELVKLAKYFSEHDEHFDITIGPLVKAWNIGFNNAHVPSAKDIQKLKKLSDPHAIILNRSNSSIYLKHPGMQLDLGGIAKGYIADRLADLWYAYGIQQGIINLGGNLLFIGESPLRLDSLWRVGIQNPWKPRGTALKNIKVPACSVVTSGIYERYFTDKNNHFYHHIIDPHTGYPFKTPLMSVTVFTTKSVVGEIESSRLFFKSDFSISDYYNDPYLLGAIFIFKDHYFKTLGFNDDQLKM